MFESSQARREQERRQRLQLAEQEERFSDLDKELQRALTQQQKYMQDALQSKDQELQQAQKEIEHLHNQM